ncbi:hypothetical protein, partial [Methylovulum sp.]
LTSLQSIPEHTMLGRVSAGTGPVEVFPLYTAGDNISIVDHVISATGGGGRGTVWPMFLQAEGTIPTLVGSIRLPSGTYTPSAQIGSGHPGNATTLLLKSGTTTIATLGGVAGGVARHTAAPFTLAAASDIDLYLYCSTDYDNAYLKGLELL